jgi:hypothetical protein
MEVVMVRTRTIGTVLFVVGTASPAFGQDALGDGRALDNSLSTQSRYNARRPSLAQELRFRNAIVTGNAPSGLSFRGDVGYRAPGEFEGELGSNDLFAFRRDALYSGLAGMGIRGSEALQLQFALTTGGRPPRNLIGSLSFPRDIPVGYTTGHVPESISGTPTIGLAPPDPVTIEGTMMGSLRAPSAYEANRGYQPMFLYGGQSEETGDWYGVTASELRGIRLTELSQPEQTPPPGRLDGSIAPERFSTSFEALAERLSAQAEQLATPAPEDETDTRSPWEIRLRELQNQLILQEPKDEASPDAESGDGESGESGSLPFDPATLEILRGVTGPPSKNFVPPDAHGVYAEHMQRGQELLESGRYFDAEERFAHALTIRPNDVTAQIARIHAQIGAGMFLSAALNLRTLLLENPDAVSARFDAKLLASPDRLADIVKTLRAGIAKSTVESPVPGDLGRGRAAGLLLAYIGIQTQDADLVREGVAAGRNAIDRSRLGTADKENMSERLLLDLIESVWADSKPE